MNNQIRYEARKLDSLMPDAANPRKIKKKNKGALAGSIKRFGLVQPIVINEKTGHVVGGHKRLEILREEGVEETMVAIGSWTLEEERALNVVLNNPDAQGEFTDDVGKYLQNAFKALTLDDFRTLRLDNLTIGKSKRGEGGGERRSGLSYKLVIECKDEGHQAELYEELDQRGLTVKLLMV